jgi:hypothetical protein
MEIYILLSHNFYTTVTFPIYLFDNLLLIYGFYQKIIQYCPLFFLAEVNRIGAFDQKIIPLLACNKRFFAYFVPLHDPSF